MRFLQIIAPAILLIAGANFSFAQTAQKTNQPMTISDDGANFTLANGIVTAKIEKLSGSLVSLEYKNLEMLGAGSGRSNGY